MTSMFSAHVEVRRRDLRPDDVATAMATLEHYGAAIGMSPRGWVSAQLSVPATGLAQAFLTAHALALSHLGEPVAVEVMTEEEFDARQGFVPIPELVGASDAAAMIGVTRQRVLQMVEEGKLQGQVIGRSTVIPRSAVDAWLDRHEMDGR